MFQRGRLYKFGLICTTYLLLLSSCEREESSSNSPLPEDCAGVPGGTNICGCTDSTAFNYNNSATYDDGSCQLHVDNGDYFITFDGANAFVDLGDIQPEGSYTKAAWVKRKYAYNFKHNILSGNSSHAFWAPQSQGARLSAGHQDNFFVVQDSDSIPEDI